MTEVNILVYRSIKTGKLVSKVTDRRSDLMVLVAQDTPLMLDGNYRVYRANFKEVEE